MLPGAVSSSDEPIALKARMTFSTRCGGRWWSWFAKVSIFDGRLIDKLYMKKVTWMLNLDRFVDVFTCLIAPRIFVLSKRLACFSTQELRRQLKVIGDATAISRLWSDVLCLRFRPKAWFFDGDQTTGWSPRMVVTVRESLLKSLNPGLGIMVISHLSSFWTSL